MLTTLQRTLTGLSRIHLSFQLSLNAKLKPPGQPIKVDITWQQCRGLKLWREKVVRSMYWRGKSFDRVKLDLSRRTDRAEWNYRSEIFAFSRRLQENLSEDTLRRIFAHASYIDAVHKKQEKLGLPPVSIQSNEDLIARGRKVLEDCLRPYLRFTFDRMPEEGITSITAYLTSEVVLADIAKWIGCTDIILAADWPPLEKTMADTTRAVLAGIEADFGKDRAQRFTVDMIISYLNDKDILDDVWHIPHPKDTLNNILVNSRLPRYEPRLMFQTGVRTIESCHIVGLYVDKKYIGSSAGETLQIAEECAALDALRRLFDLTESRAPFVYGEDSEKINFAAYTRENPGVKEFKFRFVN